MTSKTAWEIRDSILDIAKKMSSRIRICGGEIEVDMKGKRTSSSIRMKVVKSNTKNTLMKIVHSGYDMNGAYFTKDKEVSLPTSDVNELFYSIAQHQYRKQNKDGPMTIFIFCYFLTLL